MLCDFAGLSEDGRGRIFPKTTEPLYKVLLFSE
jgi:hypothetical protein